MNYTVLNKPSAEPKIIITDYKKIFSLNLRSAQTLLEDFGEIYEVLPNIMQPGKIMVTDYDNRTHHKIQDYEKL